MLGGWRRGRRCGKGGIRYANGARVGLLGGKWGVRLGKMGLGEVLSAQKSDDGMFLGFVHFGSIFSDAVWAVGRGNGLGEQLFRHPGLDPGSRCLSSVRKEAGPL